MICYLEWEVIPPYSGKMEQPSQWACKMWAIEDFRACTSKSHPDSEISVLFKEKNYKGWVTIAKEGRKTPAYRLWYQKPLTYELKDVFLMSFVRDIEDRLRKSKGIDDNSTEDEIPFWEFLDIEYERATKQFKFQAYYTQKPVFSELFKRFIESPVLNKIDDELQGKEPFRIHKGKWRPRAELESELGANNVLYYLVDLGKSTLPYSTGTISDTMYYLMNSSITERPLKKWPLGILPRY